jgi:hypothetical protein
MNVEQRMFEMVAIAMVVLRALLVIDDSMYRSDRSLVNMFVVPILGKSAPATLLRKLLQLVGRLVRFMFCLDGNVVNKVCCCYCCCCCCCCGCCADLQLCHTAL